MNKVYKFTCYKGFLKALVSEKKGLVSKMADAAGCQKSYVSQILNGKPNFTMDQAWSIANLLMLKGEDADYFLLMVDYERANTASYQTLLKKKLQLAREAQAKISRQIAENQDLPDAIAQQYYSSWHFSAVHILISISEFDCPEKISARLGLNPIFTEEIVRKLVSWKMIVQENGKLRFASSSIHTPGGAPHTKFHHFNWRMRMVEKIASMDSSSLHFTMVQSISKKDFERVKEFIIEFISHVNKTMSPSEPEELVNLNIDFGRI